MTTKESAVLSRVAGWNALMGIGALFVLNELFPVIFGSGVTASWDWSFIFVTLRFIIVPLASLLCFGTNVAIAIQEKRLSSSLVLRCVGAALLVALCWARQGTTFGA